MNVREWVKVWHGEALLGVLWIARGICKPPALRNFYLTWLARLIRRTGLFDSNHYLDCNGDVATAAMPPLRHYAAYGDREGRWPMPLFDPAYYRARAGSGTMRVNALLHYAHIGRFRRVSPSPWFDVQYYLSQNKDVARSGVEPLLHYLQEGGQEGRSPHPQFDGEYYLLTNPDVQAARLNPLVHYLQYGRYEERPTRSGSGLAISASTGAALGTVDPVEAWQHLPGRRAVGEAVVDVVVPVYKDKELTLRCLHSVLDSDNQTPFELIVIDDCSPDGELAATLERLAERGYFTLQRNAVNRGFVQTANRGLLLHAERDVLLLNSDTEVYGNWLDRLRLAAQRHPRTASVTPLSNNATICSYPRFLHDNPYPLEIDYGTLDGLAARANAGFEAEAPTGVGFCMYLRRDSLAETGLFDEVAFGKGYGEENDWCQRARQRGWRNIVAADVFVRHVGGASFGGEKAKRITAAMKVLADRHPGYQGEVDEFILRDPLAEARRRLDWERLKSRACVENTLIVGHNRGGGAERHIQEDAKRLIGQGKGVFFLRPQRGRPSHVRFGHPACRQLLNQPIYRLADTAAITQALRELRITCIHSHGLVDFTPDATNHLLSITGKLGVPLQVDIHDYKVICPRINLADRSGRYCGEPGEQQCDNCLASEGSDFGARSIRDWRHMHRRKLRHAEKIWVPDADVAERLSRYFPDVCFSVVPHESLTRDSITLRTPHLEAAERLRIAAIGAIGRIKGYDVLLACARDAAKRRLPIDYSVLGYSMNDRLLEQAGVHVTGRYLEEEAAQKLDALALHAVWLPSTWPETYSYTLSLALKGGYPVFAFDLGAIARRLRELGQTDKLWPIELVDSPSRINDLLLAFAARHRSSKKIS